jgi:hypothetical protein
MPLRSSFTAKLIAYRDSMKPYKPGIAGPFRNATDLRVIEQWIQHPDREAIWETIQQAAPDLREAELIKAVTRAKRKAVGVINEVFGAPPKERPYKKTVRVFEPDPDREFERPISRLRRKRIGRPLKSSLG